MPYPFFMLRFVTDFDPNPMGKLSSLIYLKMERIHAFRFYGEELLQLSDPFLLTGTKKKLLLRLPFSAAGPGCPIRFRMLFHSSSENRR